MGTVLKRNKINHSKKESHVQKCQLNNNMENNTRESDLINQTRESIFSGASSMEDIFCFKIDH